MSESSPEQAVIDALRAVSPVARVEALRRAIEDAYKLKREAFIADNCSSATAIPSVLASSDEYRDDTAVCESWLPKVTSFPVLPPASGDLSNLIRGDFEAFGRQPNFQDGILLRFLVARKFDQQSAVIRFFAFRTLIITYKLTFILTDEIRAAIGLNAFACFPPMLERHDVGDSGASSGGTTKQSRVVLIVHPRSIDWNLVSVDQMRKTWFFAITNAYSHSFSAQYDGLVLQNSMKGVSVSNFSPTFMKFLATAMMKALPCRISAGFIANQPFMFGSVIWPLLKGVLSEKMRKRMHVLGTAYSPVKNELKDDTIIDEELGGKLLVTTPEFGAAQLAWAEEQHVSNTAVKV